MGKYKKKGSERIQMEKSEKDLLSDSSLINHEVTVKGNRFALKEVISVSGFKSVVWRAKDEDGEDFALKFTTSKDYVDSPFRKEVSWAKKLNNSGLFARLYYAELKTIVNVKCVVFVEEYIKGTPLQEIQNERVTLSFVINFIKQMCSALNVLRHQDYFFRHDDLHTGNVIITPPKKGIIESQEEIRIIDMGSLKKFDDPLKDIKNGFDDLKNFCQHVVFLLNKLQINERNHKRILTIQERFFIKESMRILETILDDDDSRALRRPELVHKHFSRIYERSFIDETNKAARLLDPFDYIATEHIDKDELVIQLFADLPWVQEILSETPILLSGPRGCGKSILLRRYSLKVLLLGKEKVFNGVGLAGFYISCSSEFSNRFSLVNSEILVKKFKNNIIHYFNLTLLKEVLLTLNRAQYSANFKEKLRLDIDAQLDIFNWISKKLKLKRYETNRLEGARPLEHIYEFIIRELNITYGTFLDPNSKLKTRSSITFLSEFTTFLYDRLDFFQTKKIAFFLDDYSVHRIPIYVQQVLNQIIWDRQAHHIFKISSEKYGAETLMENKVTAEPSREFREIDIGRYYINLAKSGKQVTKFASELLDHRLKLAGYSGTAAKLIGPSSNDGQIGLQIRNKENSSSIYHGVETISKICSGDISSLIEIYREIFNQGRVAKNTTKLVSKHTQHKAITTVSRHFFSVIRTYHPKGPEMYDLVSHFGNLCRKIVAEGSFQFDKKTRKKFPNETSRIEVEQNTQEAEDWSPSAKELSKELVRRAVFIELEEGRGRHTLGPTIRWQLRRIYNPSFLIGMTKNTAIKWHDSDFKHFLADPKDKCELEYERKWKLPPKEKGLFDEDH